MKKNKGIAGVWTALITPFDQQGGVDLNSFSRLVDAQIEAGVSGLVVSGTTGESPTLTFEEKILLIERCREIAGRDVRVMAGTGGSSTKSSISLSKAAVEAGADSLLVVTPPYNKPSMAGLTAHFSAIAEVVPVPICLYHVPGRTAQKLTATQLAELCEIKGIEAVKEASADLALFADCERLCDAALLSGDDATYLASLAVGGQGCISVVSNVFPKAMVQLTKAMLAGDLAKAHQINRALMPVIAALFIESNPAPTKYVLASEGIGENTLRAPLAPVTPNNAKIIDDVIKGARKELV